VVIDPQPITADVDYALPERNKFINIPHR